MKREAIALAAGTLFGAGLALGQMTNPAKVLAFLDVSGAWDPSLAFVMGGALFVTAIAHRVRLIRGGAATRHAGVDARLLTGAAIFGLGWGLAGLCPGPAIASLVTGSGEVALFVTSMIAGMGLYRVVGRVRPRSRIAA